MTRALVVHCHPSEGSLVAAARDRVLAGLAAAGAEVRLTDLYADGFDPSFSALERARHLEPGTDPSISGYADDLRWCDTLILVYPTWWSGQPAMLKGWIDRVWVNGVAWTLPDGANRLSPGLRNVRRLVAVTTHGSSKWINAIEGEGGKRTLTRSLRTMCHPLARTTWLALYNVDTAPADRRAAFLDRVERRLSRLA
ncbi:MAG TPA: NAD(P)H-dependent oxidoreductase [Ilumatobacteraceae bacterium]|nr:NAD(P)H-dependent oxidoreductase [Ilumatobacteraceae bacterium]